jgi:hypothetical protein
MRRTIAVAVALSALAANAGAQTLQQIVTNTRNAALARTQRVNNFTLVEDVNGVEVTTYHEKVMVDGFPRFNSRVVPARGSADGPGRTGGAEAGGGRGRGRGGGGGGAGAVAQLLEGGAAGEVGTIMSQRQFTENARLDGSETVDGKRAYRIVLDDMSTLDMVRNAVGTNSTVTPKSMTVWLDAAQYVPLKAVATFDVNLMGNSVPASATVLMQDYRNTQGVMHPFRTETKVDGLGTMFDVSSMSPEQLEMIRALIARLPEEQRAAAMAALNSAGQSGGNALNRVSTVKSVRVNAGPPG